MAGASLYPLLLGPDFRALSPLLQAVHGRAAYLRGSVTVIRGSWWLAHAIAGLAGMPRACADAPCTVSLAPEAGAVAGTERWVREMAGSRFCSLLKPVGAGEFDESFGWFHFRFRLELVAAGVRFTLHGFRVLGLPVPQFLRPRITTLETERDGAYAFLVEAALPGVGLLVAYHGLLRPL